MNEITVLIKDPTEFSHPFCHDSRKTAVCEPASSSYQTLTLPAPGSWTSSLPNCEKINVCCLSYAVYGVLIIAAQTKTSWETSGFVATQSEVWVAW